VHPEVLISLPASPSAVTSIRSTLIQSSLNTLRKRGHFERYCLLVSPQHKTALLETLAPEWLALEVAVAHYVACDALGLPGQELHDIGEDVGDRIQGTFISTLVRRTRTVGLTPWVVVGQIQRLWERLILGGAVGLTRTGPRDCTVETQNLDLCRYSYFRAAFCGVIASGLQLGAGKGVTVSVPSSGNFAQRCLFKCSWV